ncbi:hypothetical protein TNCV_1870501 [Trichonephila clavipes]|nr:hypothetical protein TNCV_1870501 [Trichonephila clavipes]
MVPQTDPSAMEVPESSYSSQMRGPSLYQQNPHVIDSTEGLVIFSDSKSAIEAIRNGETNISCDIITLLEQLHNKRKPPRKERNPGTGLETQEGTGIISQALGNRFRSGTQHWNRMVDAQELVNTRLNCMDPQSQTTPEKTPFKPHNRRACQCTPGTIKLIRTDLKLFI